MAADVQPSRRSPWITALLVFCSVCVLPTGCFTLFCTAPNVERTAAQVPLGSKLADLDELAASGWEPSSDASEYRPVSGNENFGEYELPTKMGAFRVHRLCEFNDWKATDEERNRFTGHVILMYHSMVIPDDLNPSFEIVYQYKDGVLFDKGVVLLAG